MIEAKRAVEIELSHKLVKFTCLTTYSLNISNINLK